jgi:hypothetical protein
MGKVMLTSQWMTDGTERKGDSEIYIAFRITKETKITTQNNNKQNNNKISKWSNNPHCTPH